MYKCRVLNEDGVAIHLDKEIPTCEGHEEGEEIEDTQCWPRDWLPHDCPNARIIAVDYDSFVTRWSGYCPIETDK